MVKPKALVVVMGDLARSPRMQYHCISLANNNFDVTVLATGCKEDKSDRSREELENNGNIQKIICDEKIDLKKYLPPILAYILKPLWITCLLTYLFSFVVPRTNVIIVQNPPSIPILPFLYLYSRILGIKLIIDWHNYGYSILSLNLKATHPMVKVYKFIEFFFGSRADAGFCVSEAMARDLTQNLQIKYPITVLYDKPPKHFKPLNLREKHNFFLKIQKQLPEFKPPKHNIDAKKSSKAHTNERFETRFTMPDVVESTVIRWRPDRPAIVLTSTSWTEDEDFDILFETLDKYNEERSYQLAQASSGSSKVLNLPSLMCVITGKGPLKEYYQRKITERRWEHVDVVFPWLSADDYPKMVASCDIGICLHKSSSGVDLPMKVVDMFGCGIPVLAHNYPAIGELVVEDHYGLTFESVFDCCTKLCCLLADFHKHEKEFRGDTEGHPLASYKKNIKRRFLISRWEDNWNSQAKPVFEGLVGQGTNH